MPDTSIFSWFVISVTPFRQNCTVIVEKDSNRCAVIDPGGDVDVILGELVARKLTVEKIWITHGHLDHGGGAKRLKEITGAPIEGPQKEDAFWAGNISQSAENFGIDGMESFTPDRWLNDGDTVSLGNIAFQVIHCPGHTPGHVVYYNREANFAQVGDVLFKGSIGRTDLPRSNPGALIDAITQKLWPLGDVFFIPGHGGTSTFAAERQSNPFVADAVLQRL